MRSKLIMSILMFSILVTTNVYANSIFSFYGFPEQNYNNDVYGLGMGEASIGDTFRRNTSLINPSLSTTLNQVYFSTGISSGMYYFKDVGQKHRNEAVHFPYFNVTVPLSNHRVGFNFSSYLSGNADVYSYDIEWEQYTFTEINKIRSNIYKASFFYALKNSIANVGISLDYSLGHRYRSWKQLDWKKTDGVVDHRFEPSQYELNRHFKSFGFGFGANKTFGDVSFGASYQSATSLDSNSEYLTRHKKMDVAEKDFETPHHLALGAAWRITDRFRVASDINYEMWSQSDYYDDAQDSYKLSLGFAFEPRRGYERWYGRLPVRVGGYYRTLPFEANESSIDETAATFGFTIPLQSPNNQIDFSLKYMVRGNVDDNVYADESIIFTMSLSGFDFFSSRRKRIEDRDIPKAEFETFRY